MTENTKMDIELMKKDIGMISKLLEKFDTTIEKLQQVANDIAKVVSLQEQRMQQQDKLINGVEEALEHQQKENNAEIKALHDRINVTNREVTEKMETSQAEILKKISEVKDSLDSKIKSLEMWRYMVMGIISFAVFLLSQVLGIAKLFIH